VRSHRLLTMRALPHQTAAQAEYSSYNWPQLLKYSRQLLLTGGTMEEGLDWSRSLTSHNINKSLSNLLVLRGPDATHYARASTHLQLQHRQSAASTHLPSQSYANSGSNYNRVSDPLSPTKLNENYAQIDLFQSTQLFSEMSPFHFMSDPSSAQETWFEEVPLLHYARHCSMLSNSRFPVRPIEHVLSRAQEMFLTGYSDSNTAIPPTLPATPSHLGASRRSLNGQHVTSQHPFLHHYEKYGIGEGDFVGAFQIIGQVLDNYRSLSPSPSNSHWN